jgi:RNA polymerase sigma factor (sigma-70 family)
MGGSIMDIKNILENKELKKLLTNSVEKSYERYKLCKVIEKDDFYQECYIFVLKKIKLFDESKSSIRTYLPLLVMTCAKTIIRDCHGHSKFIDKRDFVNSLISLDYNYQNDGGESELYDVIGEYEDTDLKLIIDEILNMSNLSNYHKDIIRLLYKGYTKSEVAEILNKDRSNLYNTFERIKKKILQKYANEHII